jgi:hypothetical protein
VPGFGSSAPGLLRATGWTPPDPDALPTGGELLEGTCIRSPPRRHSPAYALATAWSGSPAGTPTRSAALAANRLPFVVRLRTRGTAEHELETGAVIDASGTWTHPNPRGANGLPALGEQLATIQGRVVTGLSDTSGADAGQFAGRRVLVVGAGHSAATSLLALTELRAMPPAPGSSGRCAQPRPARWLKRAAPKPTNCPPGASSPATFAPWSRLARSNWSAAFASANSVLTARAS